MLYERREQKALPPPRRVQHSRFEFTEDELRARAEWAAWRGYRDWDQFLDEVYDGRESIIPFVNWCGERFASRPQPVEGFRTLGGVRYDDDYR